MSPVRWTLVLFCLLAAAALVAAEILVAVKKPPTAVTTTTGEPTRGSFPGSEIVTTLADKSPRLAAAFSFVLLAAVCADVLELSVGTGEAGKGEE